MRFLIVTFHEIAIKYESELKTQLVLSGISTNNSLGSPTSNSNSLQILSNDLSI